MVHIGNGTGQAVFADFAIRAADPDTSTGFYGNIAAGDLDVFAFAATAGNGTSTTNSGCTAATDCSDLTAGDRDSTSIGSNTTTDACCFTAANS